MIHKKIALRGNEKTTLTTYILEKPYVNEKLPLVIVCPGGGYLDCSPSEGEPVALHFNRSNYHAAVLVYSNATSNPGSTYKDAQWDIAEAIKIIRQHSDEWNVDTNKIAILGFSAGGHVCGLFENNYTSDEFRKIGKIEDIKPNAAVLCYSAFDYIMNYQDALKQIASEEEADLKQVTGNNQKLSYKEFWTTVNKATFGKAEPNEQEYIEASPIHYVGEQTPPTFVWTTFGDNILNPKQSIQYANELYEHNVPCELHVYMNGLHGWSLFDDTSAKKEREKDAHVASWSKLAVEWLDKIFK